MAIQLSRGTRRTLQPYLVGRHGSHAAGASDARQGHGLLTQGPVDPVKESGEVVILLS